MTKASENIEKQILQEWGCDISTPETIDKFLAEKGILKVVETYEDKFIYVKYYKFTCPIDKKYNAIYMIERTQKNEK